MNDVQGQNRVTRVGRNSEAYCAKPKPRDLRANKLLAISHCAERWEQLPHFFPEVILEVEASASIVCG